MALRVQQRHHRGLVWMTLFHHWLVLDYSCSNMRMVSELDPNEELDFVALKYLDQNENPISSMTTFSFRLYFVIFSIRIV